MSSLDPDLRVAFWRVLGLAIRRRRRHLNLSQAYVSRIVGIHMSALSGIEHGQRRLSLLEAIRVAAVLRIELDDLIP